MVQFTTIFGHFELIEPQFVKDIKGVGQKMTRNGRKMNYHYYSFR